mgnify:CR=1 FL=1
MQLNTNNNIGILRYLCLSLCSLGLYSTSVNALVEYNPIQQKFQQTKDYAQTLNQAATVVMGHYAKLINRQSKQIDYYPKNIQNIQIIDAKLDGLFNQQPLTTFTLNIQVRYGENKIINIQQIQEAFVFDFDKNPSLVQVNRLTQKELNPKNIMAELTPGYYLNRQFAYAWLLQLDGHDTSYPDLFDAGSTQYQLLIGAKKYTGRIQEALKNRKNWMGSGGHLLRSVKVIKSLDNIIQLELIIDWKGLSANNKWRIAKIRQVIDIQKSNQAIYKITNVNEQHLLPDFAPWEKILC